MRPTPAELISGVRTILRDVIEPELRSEYAKARLGEVRAVLAQVDWNDAGIALVRETAALQDLLQDCLKWMDADPERASWFGKGRDALAEALGDAGDGGGFTACCERKERYDAVVVLLIDPIEDRVRAHPQDGDGGRIRRLLIQHYAS